MELSSPYWGLYTTFTTINFITNGTSFVFENKNKNDDVIYTLILLHNVDHVGNNQVCGFAYFYLLTELFLTCDYVI